MLGEQYDYFLIGTTLQKLVNIIPELKEYYDKCQLCLDDIITNWDNAEFWKNICKTESGYGSRIIDGWFKEFYVKSSPKLDDYPDHIVKVDYSDSANNNQYSMYVGILFEIRGWLFNTRFQHSYS